MRNEDLVAYARRDWAAEKLTPEESLRIGDDLRRHVSAFQPDWPSPKDRQSDLATHIRVAESLRRVDASRRR